MLTEEKPSHIGHRQRVKKKFLQSLGKELHDYELLEILLFSANAQKDTKPIAKELLKKFGSLERIISADIENLKNVNGVGEAAIVNIKIINEIINRSFKNQLKIKPILNDWETLLNYCKSSIANLNYETFKVLFFDKKYCLIDDEDFCDEENDAVAVNAKLIVKKALNFSSSFIVLVHNHPTQTKGDLKPSKEDISLTNKMIELTKNLEIKILDHLIFSKDSHFSFKENALL